MKSRRGPRREEGRRGGKKVVNQGEREGGMNSRERERGGEGKDRGRERRKEEGREGGRKGGKGRRKGEKAGGMIICNTIKSSPHKWLLTAAVGQHKHSASTQLSMYGNWYGSRGHRVCADVTTKPGTGPKPSTAQWGLSMQEIAPEL